MARALIDRRPFGQMRLLPTVSRNLNVTDFVPHATVAGYVDPSIVAQNIA